MIYNLEQTIDKHISFPVQRLDGVLHGMAERQHKADNTTTPRKNLIRVVSEDCEPSDSRRETQKMKQITPYAQGVECYSPFAELYRKLANTYGADKSVSVRAAYDESGIYTIDVKVDDTEKGIALAGILRQSNYKLEGREAEVRVVNASGEQIGAPVLPPGEDPEEFTAIMIHKALSGNAYYEGIYRNGHSEASLVLEFKAAAIQYWNRAPHDAQGFVHHLAEELFEEVMSLEYFDQVRVVPATAVGSIPEADSYRPQDVPVLIRRATDVVQQTFPEAFLIEMVGVPLGGQALSAYEKFSWRYIFHDPAGETAGSVIVGSDACHRFGSPVLINQPWSGGMLQGISRAMSLDQAVALMCSAGHTEAFATVALRQPLSGGAHEAMYFFSLPEKCIAVGTVSGSVKVIG